MKKDTSTLLLPIILLSFALASCNGGSSDSEDASSDTSADPNTTYTVSFDLNFPGAEGAPATQPVAHGGLLTEPIDPARSGYNFLHWASDIYGATAWNFSSDTVTSDLTLYASWQVAEVEAKTFYVDIPEYWKTDSASVAMYMWDDNDNNNAWPGVRMNNVVGGIYSYELGSQYNNFIFVRVSPTDPVTDWGAKTINLSLDLAGNNNLFVVAEEVVWGDPGCNGTWSVYTT
jgi:hypothetical protein